MIYLIIIGIVLLLLFSKKETTVKKSSGLGLETSISASNLSVQSPLTVYKMEAAADFTEALDTGSAQTFKINPLYTETPAVSVNEINKSILSNSERIEAEILRKANINMGANPNYLNIIKISE